MAGRLEAVLHTHHVRLYLARVADEGGVGVTLGHKQLDLGGPACRTRMRFRDSGATCSGKASTFSAVWTTFIMR